MATIRDIAAATGVSPSTVSKALRSSNDINSGTAEKIRSVAASMGYRLEQLYSDTPNTKTIGVVFPEFGSQYYCGIFDSFRRRMKEEGYRTVTMLTDFESVEEQEKCLEHFISSRVSGILFLTENNIALDRIRALIEMTGIKLVMITMMNGIDFCDVISVNHNLGVRIAVEHLYKIGHRRIAFLGEKNTIIRQNAFRQTTEEFGLPYRRELTVVNQLRFEECGYEGMKELLSLPSDVRPTACFAAYDDIAYGAMKALREAGLTVPGDMSVIGVNNNTVSRYLATSLSSIDPPVSEVGSTAAKLLVERIKGDKSPLKTILLSPKLCARESTSSPGKVQQ
jgi:LacI family transcriptional regulator